MIDEDGVRRRWEAIGSKFDERAQRMFAAAEVRTAGWGGLKAVARITGLARSTINRDSGEAQLSIVGKGEAREVLIPAAIAGPLLASRGEAPAAASRVRLGARPWPRTDRARCELHR
jgi:hypothetical protein